MLHRNIKPADLNELADLRWPSVLTCPRCNSTNAIEAASTDEVRSFYCRDCRQFFSPLTNSYIDFKRIPLRAWLDTYHAELNGGTSARAVAEQTGVAFRTALKMLQQVRRGLEHNTFDAP